MRGRSSWMKTGGTNWNMKCRGRAEHGGRVKRLCGGPRERAKNRRWRSWICTSDSACWAWGRPWEAADRGNHPPPTSCTSTASCRARESRAWCRYREESLVLFFSPFLSPACVNWKIRNGRMDGEEGQRRRWLALDWSGQISY